MCDVCKFLWFYYSHAPEAPEYNANQLLSQANVWQMSASVRRQVVTIAVFRTETVRVVAPVALEAPLSFQRHL